MPEYTFTGSLYNFDRCVAEKQLEETTAETLSQAINNITYKLKINKGYISNSKFHIYGEIIERRNKYYNIIYKVTKENKTEKDCTKKYKLKDCVLKIISKNLEINENIEFNNIDEIYLYIKIKNNYPNTIQDLIKLLDNMGTYRVIQNNKPINKEKIVIINNKILYNNENYIIENDYLISEQINLFNNNKIIFED